MRRRSKEQPVLLLQRAAKASPRSQRPLRVLFLLEPFARPSAGQHQQEKQPAPSWLREEL
jgi:hypothetical protein